MYCLKVGDKRLEMGAFSIEMIPFGRSGLVSVKYNATLAPLSLATQLVYGVSASNALQGQICH